MPITRMVTCMVNNNTTEKLSDKETLPLGDLDANSKTRNEDDFEKWRQYAPERSVEKTGRGPRYF